MLYTNIGRQTLRLAFSGDRQRRAGPAASGGRITLAEPDDRNRLRAPLRSPLKTETDPSPLVYGRGRLISGTIVSARGPMDPCRREDQQWTLGWRNWQTRRIQDPVGINLPWGFDSPPEH